MPVNVIRHTNEPVPPPPPTYDLMGLTREQAAMVRDLVGLVSDPDASGTYEVYRALYNSIPGVGSDWQFRPKVVNNLVETLTPLPLG